MSIRRTSQTGSPRKSASKISRLRDKTLQIRAKIKHINHMLFERHTNRMAWWQRAFRTPMTRLQWVYSSATSMWAALLSFLGLGSRKSFSLARRHGEVARTAKSKFRGLIHEGLEQRQLLAADIEFGAVSMSTEGVMTGGPFLIVKGDLSASVAADREVSFTIINSSTEAGDVTSVKYEIPQKNFVVAETIDLQGVGAITITDDQYVEGSEAFSVFFQSIGNDLKTGNADGIGGTTLSTTHTINDNDTAVVTLSGASKADENLSPHNVVVSLTLSTFGSGPAELENAVSVNLSQKSGTATSGTDYKFPGTPHVIFPATSKDSTANVALTVTNDLLVEGDETAELELTVAGGPATASGTHTVTIDDDDTAKFSIEATKNVDEAIGPQDVKVTLTLGGSGMGTAELASALKVDVTDAFTGSATDVTDYASIGTQMLTFAAGSKNADSQVAKVDPVSDGLYEFGGQTVDLKLGNLSSDLNGQATLDNTSSVVTIVDDESAKLSISATGSFGEDGAKTPPVLTLNVTGTKSTGAFALESSVGVSFAATPGTASALDYNFTLSDIILGSGNPDGATVALSAGVSAVNDGLLEGDEAFEINISSPTNGATLGNAKSTVSIIDNESAVLDFSPGVTNGSEGSSSIASDVVTLKISGTKTLGDFELGTGVTVGGTVTSVGGTATPVTDYALSGTAVSFTGGAKSGATTTVGVVPVNDATLEGTETVDLELGSLVKTAPVGSPAATLGTTTSQVNIEDDESFTLNIAGGTVKEELGKQATAPVTLTITPGPGSSGSAEIGAGITIETTVSDTPGTATAPDYTLAGGKVTFVATDKSNKSITTDVTPFNDSLYEGTESFTAKISAAVVTGATGVTEIVGIASAQIDITDDEQAKIKFVAASSDVHEKTGPANVAVALEITGSPGPIFTLAKAVSANVIVDAPPGTAAAGIDYSGLPQTVTFNSGDASEKTATVTITIADDGIPEGKETANFALGTLTGGATVGATAKHTLTIHDALVSIKAIDTNPVEDKVSNAQFQVSIDTPSAFPTVITFEIEGTSTADVGGPFPDFKFVAPSVTGSGPTYTVTIPAGQSTAPIDIDIEDDILFDPNETIKLKLLTASALPDLVVVDATKNIDTMTIQDNEGVPQLSIGTLTNGSEGTPTAGSDGKFKINLTSAFDAATTAVFTVGGDATEGVDYDFLAPGKVPSASSKLTVTVPAGTTTFDIVVDVLPEGTNVEATENVSLTPLSLVGGTVIGGASSINITDDDGALVSVSAGTVDGPDVTTTETAGNTNVNFTMRTVVSPFMHNMTSSTDTTVTFSKTQDADTTYGVDYVAYSNINTDIPLSGGNNTFATAQSLNGEKWNLAPNANIASATSIPHVTIAGTSTGAIVYYSFTLVEPSTVTIDYDSAVAGTAFGLDDSVLGLWDSSGVLVASNDDTAADAGSVGVLHSLITTVALGKGTYVIGLAGFAGHSIAASGFGVGTAGLLAGTPFDLHVSAANPQSAEPTQVLIRSGDSTGTVVFNPIDDATLESDEFVQYTISSVAGDPQIDRDLETKNTLGDNVTKITLDETTTGTVKIEGTTPGFVNVGTNRLNGIEGSADGRFLITMDKPADRAVVVPFEYNPSSVAKINDDFKFDSKVVAGTGTPADPYRVTIAAGATTAIIDIIVTNDLVVELDEVLTLDLLDDGSSGGNNLSRLVGPDGNGQLVPGTPSSDSIQIKDEDLAVINVNSSVDFSVEGGSDGEFTIYLSQGKDDGFGGIVAVMPLNPVTASTDTVVTYSISGSAANALDIDLGKLPMTGTVTIPAGSTGATFTVDALKDLPTPLNEATEEVVLKILSKTAGDSNIVINKTGDQDTVFVLDDDTTTVTIVATDNKGAENPDDDAFFTVFLNGATITPPAAITVSYSVGGSATGSLDYKALTGTVTIPSGQTSATILIDVQDDMTVDPSETVIITLTGTPTGAPPGVDVKLDSTPSNITATATIDSDDKGTVKIFAKDGTAREGADNGEFIVELSNPSATGLLVNYTVTTSAAPNDSTPGSDYKTLSGSVFVNPNQTQASIPVLVIDDFVNETNSETVIVNLLSFGSIDYGPDPMPANTTATVTILPDQQVKVVPGVDAIEGSKIGTFILSIDSPSTTPTDVSYKFTGDALEGTDYASQVHVATIPTGQTSTIIGIDPTTIGNDFVLEGTETVTITLLAVDNKAPDVGSDITLSTLAANKTADIKIFDDDKAYVTIAGADGKEGGANGKFTVTLRDINGNPTTSTTPIVVDYNTLGTSTALPGGAPNDYDTLLGKITIPAGSTNTVIDVVINNDAFVEGTETVNVELTTTDDARVQIGTIAGKFLVFQNNGVYLGTEDIYVDQGAPTVNKDTFGLFSNTDAPFPSGTTAQHSLLKFGGLFNPGAILAGSTIANATLDVWVPYSLTTATGGGISLHQMLVNWNESFTWDATGGIGDFVKGLAANGVDASAAGIAFTLVEPGGFFPPPGINTIPVTSTVQNWSNGQSNFGWAILPTDTADFTNFLDSEFITAGLRPRLNVTVSTAATVNIIDDDVSTINIAGSTNAKEDITNGVVTVAVSNPIPADNTLFVNYSVGGGGSAVAGSDYTAKTGVITITGGTTSSTFDVPVLMDLLIEGNEDVQVELTGFTVTGLNAAAVTSSLSLGTKSSLVTIEDNDSDTVSVAVLTKGTEAPALPTVGHTDPVFRISLGSTTSTLPTVVEFTIGGSSDFIAGDDYVVPVTKTVTIPAGSMFTDFTLDLIDDELNESSETATMTLTKITSSNPGITLGTKVANDTIEDDDSLVANVTTTKKFAFENPTSNTGEFTIDLNFASDQNTTIPFTISGDVDLPNFPAILPATNYPTSAVSGPDYGLTVSGPVVVFTSPTTGTVTFPASTTPQSAKVIVTAIQDYVPEPGPNQQVILTLGQPLNTNGPGGKIGGLADTDTVEIVDEDFTVTIEKTSSPAQEDGPPLSGLNGQFTVTIANPTPIGVPVTVPFEIVNGKVLGTATYDDDYVVNGAGVSVTKTTASKISGFVTIAGGSTQAVITVDVEADSLTEGNENVVLTILAPSDSKGLSKLTTVPSLQTATETIEDNDVSKVSISVIDNTNPTPVDVAGIAETAVAQQNNGAFRFSVDKKVEYVDTVVEYKILGTSTATNTKDYTLGGTAGTVTIPFGSFSTDIALTVLTDLEVEGDETVVLQITKVSTSPPQAVSVNGSKDTATATIKDDDVVSVSIKADDADAKEPSNPGIFILSLPPGVTSKTNTVVTYTTTGTANTGTIGNKDYVPLSGTATILAGQTTASITVSVLDDDVVEADETVIVTLDPTTSNPLISASGKDTVIIDSEDTSDVSILSVVNGAEDSTPAKITVSMTKIADVDITIPLDDKGGTATGGGTDYTLPASITILAGQTSATTNVAVTSDTLVEGTENFTVGLKAPTGLYVPPDVTSSSGTKLINITDNDTNVLKISSPTIKEGDSGTKTLEFVVTSQAVVADKFTVAYSVSGGTAKSVADAGGHIDFAGGSGTLNFSGAVAGETSTFTITINGDEVVEADETVQIKLGTVTSPTKSVESLVTTNAVGTGTIENDDTATFTVVQDPSTASEGSTVTFKISSNKEIDIPVDLTVSYSGGTATGVSFSAKGYKYAFGHDYDNDTDTFTYPAFDTSSKSLSSVSTHTDVIVEGTQKGTIASPYGFEDFDAATTAKTASPRDINKIATVSGIINEGIDDQAVVTVTSKENVGDDEASEPGAGKGNGAFTFKLDNPVQAPVIVNYTYTIAGKAGDPDGDLKAPLSGSITIPGSTTKAIQSTVLVIEAFDDSLLEDDELVVLTITSTALTTEPDVSFANDAPVLGKVPNQTVNLQDDDTATISITAIDNLAQEPDTTPNAGKATYAVSLTQKSDTPTTVSLAIDIGTTASAADYSGLPAFITIPANTLSTTFDITATDDVINEVDEFLVVKLVPGSILGNGNITLGSSTSAKITITDDGDDLFVSVKKDRDGSEPGTAALDEGQFVVELKDAFGNPATVPVGSTTAGLGLKIIYSVTGGTANNPGDYNAPTGILTIAEGKSSGLISIDVTDDLIVEATETVEITLSGIEDSSGPISKLPGTSEKISLGTSLASLSILDNDVAAFTIDSINVNEGVGSAKLTISLSNEIDIASSVDITFIDGNATGGGVDYTSTKQTVSFAPLDKAPKFINVPINDDGLIEVTEAFLTQLSSTTVFGGRMATFGVGAVTIADNDAAIPPLQVQEVSVGSTLWLTPFNNLVDPTDPIGKQGYSIPTGTAQDDTLPWTNINQLFVKFTEDLDPLTITSSNFVLHGVNGTPVIAGSFGPSSFDTVSNILTIPLAGFIQNDRLRLEIKDAVLSTAGAVLDGDWTDGISSFNSGNGSGGTSFQFRFNVLPGDATHSTETGLATLPQPSVDAVDLSTIFASNLTTTTLATLFKDVNGSGSIDGVDLGAVFPRLLTTLPGSFPGIFAGLSGGSGISGGLSGGLGSSIVGNGTKGLVDAVTKTAVGVQASTQPSTGTSFAGSVDSVFGTIDPESETDGEIETDVIDSVFGNPFEDLLL